MASLFVPAVVLSAAAGLAAAQSSQCSNPQLSCVANDSPSCCFNSPGGQFLQTQFWDTDPSTGPDSSWTIHGLWPDKCDGSYTENCDSSRAYKDITTILQNAGKSDLLSYMNEYWVSDSESNEKFWEHEWATHGTCINTLDPSCYSNYQTGDEVVDFFSIVVNLFKSLDTYSTLSNAGIVPDDSQTYELSDIQAAFENSFGYEVYLGCSNGALYQVYYTYNVQGSLQSGTFVPTSPSGSTSNCPSSGIQYLPKN